MWWAIGGAIVGALLGGVAVYCLIVKAILDEFLRR